MCRLHVSGVHRGRMRERIGSSQRGLILSGRYGDKSGLHDQPGEPGGSRSQHDDGFQCADSIRAPDPETVQASGIIIDGTLIKHDARQSKYVGCEQTLNLPLAEDCRHRLVRGSGQCAEHFGRGGVGRRSITSMR